MSDLESVSRQVCDRVKTLRKKKGWTLEQLASLSGVSRSMLSQIERGAANPTLGVAFRIAQAFGLSLGELVDQPTGPRIDVVRSEDQSTLFREDEHCRIRTLSPLHLEKDVEFYEVRFPIGGTLASRPHFEGAREFVTVQAGEIEIRSGEDQQDLAVGDSAHYPADVEHTIRNRGGSEAVVFLVVIYER